MKGQMTLLAIIVAIFTLIVFLAIIPTLKSIMSPYYSELSSVEKFLMGLIIPAIFIGILGLVILYSRPYYHSE